MTEREFNLKCEREFPYAESLALFKSCFEQGFRDAFSAFDTLPDYAEAALERSLEDIKLRSGVL